MVNVYTPTNDTAVSRHHEREPTERKNKINFQRNSEETHLDIFDVPWNIVQSHTI